MSRDDLLEGLVAAASREYGWADGAEVARRILEREAKMPTSIGIGVAVPHARMEDRSHIQVAAACVPAGLDFRASDHKPVRLVLLLVSPAAAPGIHVQALASVSRITSPLVDQLVRSRTSEEFLMALRAWESNLSG